MVKTLQKKAFSRQSASKTAASSCCKQQRTGKLGTSVPWSVSHGQRALAIVAV